MKSRVIFLRKIPTLSLLLFLFTLLIFNIKFRYIDSGDTRPNELLPISIINEHNLDFNEFVSLEKKLPYYFKNVRGRIVSAYPIVPGILNTPVFFIANLLGIDLMENNKLLSMFSSSIISSLSVVFMFLCLINICQRRRTAIIFALVYAFATSVWSVTSRGIWQHGPSLVFITISLWLLTDENNELIPYSGFFLGMAVFNRPANIMLVLPLAMYVFFHHRKKFHRFAFLATMPAILMSWYSYVYWHNIMQLGQFLGIKGFSGNFLKGLAGLLFSPGRGLFLFTPISILSFIYLFYVLFSKKEKPLYKHMAAAGILLILLYAKWFMWWGGFCFGSRLLIEIIPILIIFLALYWEKFVAHSLCLKTIFSCFLFFSVYVHFLGAFYFPSFPKNIKFKEYLWDIKDSEITKCSIELLEDLRVKL